MRNDSNIAFHRPGPRSAARSKGFSLVELLVATVLGMAVIAIVTTVFTNISKNNRELDRSTSMIENARFALHQVRYDLLHAGYLGRYIPEFDDISFEDTPTDFPATVPDPCLAYGSWASTAGHRRALLGMPVQVSDSVPGSCGGIVSDAVTGSDVLVVRRVATCVPGDANCEPDNADALYFQASECADEVADPLTAPETPPDPNVPWALGVDTTPFTQRDCATTAEKRAFEQNIYYVRDYLVSDGDGIPALVRSEFGVDASTPTQLPVQVIAEGIERLHVELGLDLLSDASQPVDPNSPVVWADATNRDSPTNRGDGIPDSFARCTTATPCTAYQLANAVTAKIHVLVRAREPSPGYTDTKTYQLGTVSIPAYNDGFKRHVYSTSVRLFNVSGRRETP